MDLLGRIRRNLPQHTQIGPYRIRLPKGSQLNFYQRCFRRYDAALGDIATLLHAARPDLHAIDIGANVGDTAAVMRKQADIPVLCIEGDQRLLPVLRANCRQMGARVVIEPSFVGQPGMAVDVSRIGDAGRNASLVGAVVSGAAAEAPGAARFASMRDIIARHPAFARAGLVKIDTEGFDFDIIRDAADFLADVRPVVFFEYAPSFRPDTPDAGPATLRQLAALGYRRFLYYDNFGNFLVSVAADDVEQCLDLHAYLAGNQRHGTVVHYFDICAFHERDLDLARQVRQR